MSKLDNIKVKVNHPGQGTFSEPLDYQAKQQIKDLFIELIGPDRGIVGSNWELGRQELKEELRKKVNQL